MFVLHTAKPGEAWHKLQPLTRLVHVDATGLGASFELEVMVRVDYGRTAIADNGGPYWFKFMLRDAFGASDLDVELTTRRDAHNRGLSINNPKVLAVGAAHPAYKLAAAVKDHFLKVMALEQFELPISL